MLWMLFEQIILFCFMFIDIRFRFKMDTLVKFDFILYPINIFIMQHKYEQYLNH